MQVQFLLTPAFNGVVIDPFSCPPNFFPAGRITIRYSKQSVASDLATIHHLTKYKLLRGHGHRSALFPALFMMLGGSRFEVGNDPPVGMQQLGDAGFDFRRRFMRHADG